MTNFINVSNTPSKDFNESVMIALLPTTSDWCAQPLPHMTLVFAGNISDLQAGAQNELAKIALTLAITCHKMQLVVMGKDILGSGDSMVEVLLLRPMPELLAMRSIVEPWNASEFTDFKPHATIGPIGSGKDTIPNYLIFDRIALAWGNELLEFKLLE